MSLSSLVDIFYIVIKVWSEYLICAGQAGEHWAIFCRACFPRTSCWLKAARPGRSPLPHPPLLHCFTGSFPHICLVKCSVAGPDHFDMDPDPSHAFHFEPDPDPTFHFDTDLDTDIWYGSGSLLFPRGNIHKTVLLIHLTWFSSSVGPQNPTIRLTLLNFPFQWILLCSLE